MANEFGMTPNEYQNLEIVFGAAPRMHGAETPKWRAVRVADKKLFHMELSGLDGQFVDENATVFVEEFRDLTIEKGWSIIETPMKDIQHWTLNGRS